MGLGSGRIECRKLFYRMPFQLHFYDPLERVLVEIAEGLALLSSSLAALSSTLISVPPN